MAGEFPEYPWNPDPRDFRRTRPIASGEATASAPYGLRALAEDISYNYAALGQVLAWGRDYRVDEAADFINITRTFHVWMGDSMSHLRLTALVEDAGVQLLWGGAVGASELPAAGLRLVTVDIRRGPTAGSWMDLEVLAQSNGGTGWVRRWWVDEWFDEAGEVFP